VSSAGESFWSGYWRSLKSLEVEEPVDVYVHRPLAYVIARTLLPTRITPDAVTLTSLVFGLGAATLIAWAVPHHWQWAALLSFIGTVLDCADGQLARLRKSSSVLGRMLDGTCDSTVVMACAAAAGYVHVRELGTTPLRVALVLAVVVLSSLSISMHVSLFDHYKTVFLKLTIPGYREAESIEVARQNYERAKQQPMSLYARIVWVYYLAFVGGQGNTVRRYDPYTVTEFEKVGDYSEERAAIYRQHCEPVMRTWRRYFGFGSLMIGIALALFFQLTWEYLLLRLTLFNLVFWGPLRWSQQKASKAAAQALGLPVVGSTPAN
jgi:phosphatidylglycerophosphate synthase